MRVLRLRGSNVKFFLILLVLTFVLVTPVLVKVWVDSLPFEFQTAYPISSFHEGKAPTKYISIRLFGRLGNQMFQFAALLGQAYTLGYIPALGYPGHDYRPSLLDVFDITEVRKVNIRHPRKFVCGNAFYKSLPTEDLEYNVAMKGYCQSWKYFPNISDIVRKSLSFKPSILSTAKAFFDTNKKPGAILIGIHIRRGDFLKKEHLDYGRTTPGKDYIENARKYFKAKFSNVQFLVMSDDHVWCSDNIHGDDVIQSPFTDAGTDLALMSLCDHMIITTSSFGWWGAYLAGGETVYYKDFPRPGSKFAGVFNKLDYYPAAWKAMS